MEMTMSAVSVSVQVQPGSSSASPSDSGFSEVLTGVRSVQTTDSSSVQTDNAAENVSEMVQHSAEEMPEIESVKNIENALLQLVKSLNGGDSKQQDSVIRSLLEILKKMQKDGGDDAKDIVIQLLMSMLDTQAPDIPQMSAVPVRSVEPTSEIAEVISSVQTETAAVVMPEQIAVMHEIHTDSTENEKSLQTDEQPAESAEAQPIRTNESPEKLLDELLAQARKELGLTKAEVVQRPQQENAPEQQTDRPPQQSAQTAAMRLNHRDGTQELNSILQPEEQLSEHRTEDTNAQNVQPVFVQQDEVREAPEITDEPVQVRTIPPERQISEEILSKTETLSGGRTEFTMELNPESLGKITVRLVSTQGRVEVSISAENESTRQLLQSRGEHIGTALRENGVELERYQVISQSDDAQLMQDNYEGSSKNPYSRGEQQQETEDDSEGDFLELLRQL